MAQNCVSLNFLCSFKRQEGTSFVHLHLYFQSRTEVESQHEPLHLNTERLYRDTQRSVSGNSEL